MVAYAPSSCVLAGNAPGSPRHRRALSAQVLRTLHEPVLHRPTVLPVPLFVPKLRFGAELVEALLLTSHRVVPRALLDAGFEFHHPELEGALRATLAGDA